MSVSEVVIQAGFHALVHRWTTVFLALLIHEAMNICLRSPYGVICDDQIQQSIIVVVKPSTANTQYVPRLLIETRTLGHLRKRAIPVVLVKRIRSRIADEQVLVAIIVIISSRNSKAEDQGSHRSNRPSP